MSAAAPQRLGVFGGSFDPPHLAHLALAQVARDHLGLDQVLWIPVGQPWQKPRSLCDGQHRAAMVQALIASEPTFALDARELQRSGPSYTRQTLVELHAEQPQAQLVLIIGQDQYARLHTWHQPGEVLAQAQIAVAAREGQDPQADDRLAAWPHPLHSLPLPRLDISATAIRARLAQGQPVDHLVGERVARYIDQHQLYRATTH